MTVQRTIPTQANTNVATFTILSNGEPLSEEIGVSLITVNKCFNKIPSAQLVLFDGDVATEDFELSGTDVFKPGNAIEIKTGYQDVEDTIFKGIIVKHGIEAKNDTPSKL